jgi:hypothetical protein
MFKRLFAASLIIATIQAIKLETQVYAYEDSPDTAAADLAKIWIAGMDK